MITDSAAWVPNDGEIRSLYFRIADMPAAKRRCFLEQSPQYLLDAVRRNDPRHDWWLHQRPDQRLDVDGDYDVVLVNSARGTGKTLEVSHFVNESIERHGVRRMMTVGQTNDMVRDININGDDGIIACARLPAAFTSERGGRGRIRYGNGGVCYIASARTADASRGSSIQYLLLDEMAWYDDPEQVMRALVPSLRVGGRKRLIVTTTPNMDRPKINQMLLELKAQPTTLSRQVPLAYNRAISAEDQQLQRDMFPGSELQARQEFDGEIIIDEGTSLLFKRWMIDAARRTVQVPDIFNRVVLVLDPAMTSQAKSDYSAITVAGQIGSRNYILHSSRGHWSPDETAQQVARVADIWGAQVYAEINGIGDYLLHKLESEDKRIRVTGIRVKPGEDKRSRANSILGLYERQMVHHIGSHDDLEREQLGFTGDDRTALTPNDDLVDATVHALRELNRARAKPRSIGDSVRLSA